MSFKLRVLGGASLDGADGPLTGRATQRHRLAVLALLAHGGARGLTREKLSGYLWPESTEERARRLLSDSVYRINKELGADALLVVGNTLRLDADVLHSDLGAFRAALERKDWRAAVEAYGGPFLDGFHLPDAIEFERWLDGARAELQRSHAEALESLAEEAAGTGELGEAASIWQRRAALDPYDSRVAVRLMRALDEAGNRAGALRHARIHAELLQQEFGTAPHPDVEALAEELSMAPAGGGPPDRSVPSTAAEARPTPTADPGSGKSAILSPLSTRLAVAGLVALLVGTLAMWMDGRLGEPVGPADALSVGDARESTEASSRIAIAVLPFDDLSPGEQNIFFTEGITEDVLTRLSGVEGFSVIARASITPYRGSTKSIPLIAEELGVRYVVHGRVRHTAAEVRITAQLVDARTNTNVWAQTYDRRLEDIFTVQRDIAERVASALEARFSPGSASELELPPTVDLGAYDAYLRGRFQWHLRTEDGLRRSVEFFEEAVSRDPAYARAWAGLADAYAVLAFYDYLPPSEAFPRARDAALRALGIDDRLPEAHASLGYIALYHDWNADEAEASFRRSVELSPSYSTAHQWYANHLVATGRFDEAERAMNRARETNPLSLIANGALGWVYYHAGRFEEAVRQCDLALEMDPDWDLGYLWRGLALERMGLVDQAIASLERAVELSGGSGISVAALAQARASAGDDRAARATLAELLARRVDGGYRPSFEIAKAYVALRDFGEAVRWLGRAYDERSHSMVFLEVDPQLAALRSNPAFRDLVARVAF